MTFDLLLDIIHKPELANWTERNETAFDTLFGSPAGRYPGRAKASLNVRAPGFKPDSGVPFAAYIHPSNASSGPYSGLSFVVFPVAERPALIGMVVGTQGLAPDEAILGRPGHARKTQAIAAWLNRTYGKRDFLAWSKQDPTRTDILIPETVVRAWPEYRSVFDRYGREMYTIYRPNEDRSATEAAIAAFLDVLLEERGYQPIAGAQDDAMDIRAKWFDHLMPVVETQSLADLLANRRYVILQGPPGTGKTMTATKILREQYEGRGRSIQFHPNTTYENFVGGLAPIHSAEAIGLRFAPAAGMLMEAAAEALASPSHNFLLHIDEINRADLGKVLGEAMFLLECDSDQPRQITLPYDFGTPFGRRFYLPDNLHILGTMNSADRSIAIVDVALRRRFAFASLWPRMSVVDQYGCETMQKAFRDLVSIFIEHAGSDAFPLVPGHSYFLESRESHAAERLRIGIVPLLEEYLAQGYVSGFSEQIRAYLQELPS